MLAPTRVLLTAVLLACAPTRGHVRHGAEPCAGERPTWQVDDGARRSLTVALMIADPSRSGWDVHGATRLRTAATAWNAVDIPLRLAPIADAQRADITVVVVRQLPALTDDAPSLRRYRAGVTRVDVAGQRVISKAHVGIAEESPLGVPYAVEDQVATLVHELGHALGLPHAAQPAALMAAQSHSMALTPADHALAARVLGAGACAHRQVAVDERIVPKP